MAKSLNGPSWFVCLFIITEDSYLYQMGPDLPMERKTIPRKWGVGIRKIFVPGMPQLAIPVVAELSCDF